MFSPPADTTFSSFFSRAGLGAGHLQHLEWLLRLAPPWKMRQGGLLLGQDARLPVTPSFTEYTLVTLHHSFPRIFSGSGFARASPRWRLRPSSPARVQSDSGVQDEPRKVSGSLDDSVSSADWGLLTFSSAVEFLFRPKTLKLKLSLGRSLARGPAMARPLTDAEWKPPAPDLFWGFHWTEETPF